MPEIVWHWSSDVLCFGQENTRDKVEIIGLGLRLQKEHIHEIKERGELLILLIIDLSEVEK
jgi:hypothetical protein